MQDNRAAYGKLAMVENFVAVLEQGAWPPSVGAMTLSREEMLAFQLDRARWLRWAIDSEDGCVWQRVTRLRAKLSPETAGAYDRLWNDYRGYAEWVAELPLADAMLLAFIEDMLIALRMHPGG